MVHVVQWQSEINAQQGLKHVRHAQQVPADTVQQEQKCQLAIRWISLVSRFSITVYDTELINTAEVVLLKQPVQCRVC